MEIFIRREAKPRDKLLAILLVVLLAFSVFGMLSEFVPSDEYLTVALIGAVPISIFGFALTVINIRENNTDFSTLGKLNKKWVIYSIFAALWILFSSQALVIGIPAAINPIIVKPYERLVTISDITKGMTSPVGRGSLQCHGYRIHVEELSNWILNDALCVSADSGHQLRANQPLRLVGNRSWFGVTVEHIFPVSPTTPSSGPATPAAEGKR